MGIFRKTEYRSFGVDLSEPEIGPSGYLEITKPTRLGRSRLGRMLGVDQKEADFYIDNLSGNDEGWRQISPERAGINKKLAKKKS